MDSRNVVVCDNGTGYVKCGFAGENFPTSVFPCVVGRPMLRYEESLTEQALKDIVVGEGCADLRHQLDISYPVNNGIVQNWDDMCHVWDHAFFNELKVNPPDCKILLTDPPLNPSKNREKMKLKVVRVVWLGQINMARWQPTKARNDDGDQCDARRIWSRIVCVNFMRSGPA
ncbi:hypothetical protein JHK85_053842 [Glycine max]|nr:hypothetical protein JHK85_053842 [Glycine max]